MLYNIATKSKQADVGNMAMGVAIFTPRVKKHYNSHRKISCNKLPLGGGAPRLCVYALASISLNVHQVKCGNKIYL